MICYSCDDSFDLSRVIYRFSFVYLSHVCKCLCSWMNLSRMKKLLVNEERAQVSFQLCRPYWIRSCSLQEPIMWRGVRTENMDACRFRKRPSTEKIFWSSQCHDRKCRLMCCSGRFWHEPCSPYGTKHPYDYRLLPRYHHRGHKEGRL